MAKEIKQRNRMYQLYELRDSIQSAILNVQMVKTQQGHLVELIMNSKYSEELKEFTTAIVNDIKGYDTKLITLNDRIKKVEAIITIYEARDEKSEFVKDIVSKMIEALGLDQPEPVAKA